MKDRILEDCIKLIKSEVGFFNGWSVSEKTEDKACKKAAQKVIKYLNEKLHQNKPQ